MRRPGRGLLVTVLVLAAVVLASCAAGPNVAAGVGGPELAGFWLGVWHGVISPVTFVVSLFNDSVNIYEVHNSGHWYDFGFMIGISMVFSGAASSRRPASPRPPVPQEVSREE